MMYLKYVCILIFKCLNLFLFPIARPLFFTLYLVMTRLCRFVSPGAIDCCYVIIITIGGVTENCMTVNFMQSITGVVDCDDVGL